MIHRFRALLLPCIFASALCAGCGKSEGGSRRPEAVASEPSLPARTALAAAANEAGASDASAAGDAGGDAGDASAGATLRERAERCLENPTCPKEEVDRLFRAADDSGEGDCFRFADGNGTQRDLARARACMERELRSEKCDGSSAGLEQAELAIFRIDAVGGPQDIAGARKLFDGCFDDVTRQAVLAHAALKEANQATPKVNFCKEVGGTTLTGNECMLRTKSAEETKSKLQAKEVATSLDAQGQVLFVAAAKAYDTYVDAVGRYVYFLNVDGSMRNALALSKEHELLAKRTAEVARFVRFVPAAASTAQVDASRRAVESAVRNAESKAQVPEVKDQLKNANAAWLTYQSAELALYEHVHGPKHTPARTRAAVQLRLDKARIADLQN